MTPGKKLVLAVLWLGLLGGGVWAYSYFMSGESGDAVEKEFKTAWQAVDSKNTAGPDLAAFVKRVAGKDRAAVEERLKKWEQDFIDGTVLPRAKQEFEAAWDAAILEGAPGPDPAKSVEKLPAAARASVQEQLARIGQTQEAKFPRFRIALDPFSGYCVFRSPEFHKKLAQKGVRVVLHDDGGKYQERMEGLASGQTKMAVYTIDALISTSAPHPVPPASIVFLIDESKGADAILAPKAIYPQKGDLNKAGTRLVFLKDSPSATLARVVKYGFTPSQVALNGVDDYADVKSQAVAAGPRATAAFVLWEPDVTEVLGKNNGDLHVVTSSAEHPGTIVDVFVVQKDFLKQHPDDVKKVVQTYFETLAEKQPHMSQLIEQDARRTGSEMSDKAAEKVKAGIAWSDLKANVTLFAANQAAPSKVPLDAVIEGLNKSLRDALVIQKTYDAKEMYDASVLRELSGGVPPPPPLPKLADIPFSRSSTVLNTSLYKDLLDAAEKVLKDDPTLFVEFRGYQQDDTGVPEEDDYKKKRADAVLEALAARGVGRDRMKAVPGKASEDKTRSKVVFVLQRR
jgi:NitT/TauT family transport system substrate-binding protein